MMFSISKICLGFSSCPSGLTSHLPAFCFTNTLHFQLFLLVFEDEIADHLSGIPPPPGLESGCAGAAGDGAYPGSLCIFPPAVVIPPSLPL